MKVKELYRSPLVIQCPNCLGQLQQDLVWQPGPGYDRSLRLFTHGGQVKDRCNHELYLVTIPKSHEGHLEGFALGL